MHPDKAKPLYKATVAGWDSITETPQDSTATRSRHRDLGERLISGSLGGAYKITSPVSAEIRAAPGSGYRCPQAYGEIVLRSRPLNRLYERPVPPSLQLSHWEQLRSPQKVLFSLMWFLTMKPYPTSSTFAPAASAVSDGASGSPPELARPQVGRFVLLCSTQKPSSNLPYSCNTIDSVPSPFVAVAVVLHAPVLDVSPGGRQRAPPHYSSL